MFRKILIPLDNSEIATDILPYASFLAKKLDAGVVVLTVIDPGSLDETSSVTPDIRGSPLSATLSGVAPARGAECSTPPVKEKPAACVDVSERFASTTGSRVESRITVRLETIVRRLRTQGIRAEFEVALGAPAEKIVDVAREKGCDMIAMSTHGRSLVSRAILGSVTNKVIRSAHVPTLTITPERAKKYWHDGVNISRILVPLDGSAPAETVLPYVEEVTRRLSLKIVLLRAVNLANVYMPYSGVMMYGGNKTIEASAEADAVAYLKDVAESLRHKGLDVSWQVVRGVPAPSIINIAHEMSDTMIAMTTHGRTGFLRLVLGSVAEAVIRSSGDPVLVIPPALEC